MVNFQTTEEKFVAVHSSPGEDVIWDVEETEIPKKCRAENLRKKKELIF